MFDLGWSEIALVISLAFVVFGPQHLQEIVRSLCGFARQCRRLYGRWRTYLDAALYDLEFQEVRDVQEHILKRNSPSRSFFPRDRAPKTNVYDVSSAER